MSSIAYASKNYKNEPTVYTSSVQGFRGYHDAKADKPLVRRPNWWECYRIGKKCTRIIDRKWDVIQEIRE